jgi:hypothetical protein
MFHMELMSSFLDFYATPLDALTVLEKSDRVSATQKKPLKVVTVPRDKNGRHDYKAVPEGHSVWVSVNRLDHPLHGKHVLVTRGKYGYAIAHGESNEDARGDKATQEERKAALVQHDEDEGRKEKKEEEKRIKDDEAGGVFGFLAGIRRRPDTAITSPWPDEDDDGVEENVIGATRTQKPQEAQKSEPGPVRPLREVEALDGDIEKSTLRDAFLYFGGLRRGQRHEGICRTTGTDSWYHSDSIGDDSLFWSRYRFGMDKSHDVTQEARNSAGEWMSSDTTDQSRTHPVVTPKVTKLVASIVGDKATAGEIISTFEGSFAGIHAAVTEVQPYEPGDDKGFEVDGIINDDAGQKIGTFRRCIMRDEVGDKSLYADHLYLDVDKELRNKGFSLAFNGRAEELYNKLGVKEIRLEANISVGKYAWAKQGYDYSYPGERTWVVKGFARWLKGKGNPLSREEAKTLMDGHSWDLASYDNGKTYPVTLYDDDGNIDVRGRFPAGKAFLLADWNLFDYMEEACWEGVKNLSPDSPSEKMYRHYLSEKSSSLGKSVEHDVSTEARDKDGKWTRGNGETVVTTARGLDRNLDVLHRGDKVKLLRPNGEAYLYGTVLAVGKDNDKIRVAVPGRENMIWPAAHIERRGAAQPEVQALDKKGQNLHAGDFASFYGPEGEWKAWGKIMAVSPEGKVDFRMVQGQKGMSILAVQGQGPDFTGLDANRFEFEPVAPNIQGVDGFANHGDAEARHPLVGESAKKKASPSYDVGDHVRLRTGAREVGVKPGEWGEIERILADGSYSVLFGGVRKVNVDEKDITNAAESAPKNGSAQKYKQGDYLKLRPGVQPIGVMENASGEVVSYIGNGNYLMRFAVNQVAVAERDLMTGGQMESQEDEENPTTPATPPKPEFKVGDKVLMNPNALVLYGKPGEIGTVLAVKTLYGNNVLYYRVDFPLSGDRGWMPGENIQVPNTGDRKRAIALGEQLEAHRAVAEAAAEAVKAAKAAKEAKRYHTKSVDPLALPEVAERESEILNGVLNPLSVKSLGGGNVNSVYSGEIEVHTENRAAIVKVAIKPRSGLSHQKMRSGISMGRDLERERAAYVVNNALGGLVEMPECVVRDIPNMGLCGIQTFKEDTDGTLAENYNVELSGHPDAVRELALFDVIIGNLDRHGGNIMVRSGDDEHPLVAIDHGLSFPDGSQEYGEYKNTEALSTAEGKKLSDKDIERLDAMWKNYDKVDKELAPLVTKKSRMAMWQRVEWVLAEKRIPEVGDFDYQSWSSYPSAPAKEKSPSKK